MRTLQIAFWFLCGLVFYAYVLYPVLVAVAAACLRRATRPGAPPNGVSVIIAGFNEEAFIGRRVGEFLRLLSTARCKAELIVVSDGSSDGTADAARNAMAASGGDMRCSVIELPRNEGKAAALSAGVAAASNEILVFADARQSWAPDALLRLLENFANADVGAVSGDLELQDRNGVMTGVGLYWRYEKWLRLNESRLYSGVGATGAISAVRRSLFRPIPAGTILDDVYWPLRVAMQGFRVIHDERAKAYDRLPEHVADEFRRKVRTLSGNYQLLRLLPSALLPWRNPIWLQYVSHKLLRLFVPWALLGMLIISAVLPGAFFRVFLVAQLVFWGIGLAAVCWPKWVRFRMASAAASFCVLNGAAWLAFWVWVFGRTGSSWRKVSYAASSSGGTQLDIDSIS